MSPSKMPVLDGIELDLVARTKAEVLEHLAARASVLTGRSAAEIARALGDRERLGSTGVGSGVALPHADIRGLGRPAALFARLAAPVDWDAIDDRPVSLVAVVLSPRLDGGTSPGLLARFARVLRRPAARDALAACSTADAVAAVFAPGD